MSRSTYPCPFALQVVAAACALGIIAYSLAAQDPPAGKGVEEDPFDKKAPGDKGAKEGPEVKTTFDRTRIQGLLNQDPLILRHLRESNPTTPEQLMVAAEITLKVESFA